jgi:hypothetical protein
MNRNLTCDSWYTRYTPEKSLLLSNITLIYTVGKNTRELPPEFQPDKTMKAGTSLLFSKSI